MGRRILLVEDNPDDVALTMRAFRHHGIADDVDVARDGVEACDLLLGRNGNDRLHPAVVLLDLKLPKMSGLEVLGVVRDEQLNARVPMVVLSSSIQPEDVEAAYRLGANSYVRKPVDYTGFVDLIQSLAMYWLELNQLPR
jgi:two-component system response regulator